MDPQQTRKRHSDTTKAYDKNTKQRQLYRDMPTTAKKALLLQRRLKKRAATTKRILENVNSLNPTESTYVCQHNFDVGCSSSPSKTGGTSSQPKSSCCKPGVPKQTALTIQEPTPLSETVVCSQLRVPTSSHNPEKGKDICSPFVIHETGSTSGTTNNFCTPTFGTIRTSGLTKNKKSITSISRLRSDYAQLQAVPDCKFCGAKKFQYEVPGFCCGKGKEKTFIATDEALDFNNQTQFEDLLHTLNPPVCVLVASV